MKSRIIQHIVWQAGEKGVQLKESTISMLFKKPMSYLEAVNRAICTEEGALILKAFAK